MPAESEKQRRLACSDLQRIKDGKKPRTGMTRKQLEDFCRKPVKGSKSK